jgi:hypothetical protein
MSRRAREGLGRLMQADTAVQRTDWTTRRSYEDRAARSVAAAVPGPAPGPAARPEPAPAPEAEAEPQRERVS